MDTSFLEYLIVLSESKNMVSAAERLHISQPALSMALSKLEFELGFQVFERAGRRKITTFAGQSYLRDARRILQQLEEAKQRAIALAENPSSNLMISSEVIELTAETVRLFSLENPTTHVFSLNGSTQIIRDALVNHKANLCISYEPLVEPGILCEQLFTEKMFLFIGRTHPLSSRSFISLRELKNELFVNFPEEYGQRRLLDRICMLSGFRATVQYETTDLKTIEEIVQQGLAVSLLPEFIWKEHSKQDTKAVAIPIADPYCYRTVFVSRNAEKILSSEEERYLRIVRNYVSQMIEDSKLPAFC